MTAGTDQPRRRRRRCSRRSRSCSKAAGPRAREAARARRRRGDRRRRRVLSRAEPRARRRVTVKRAGPRGASSAVRAAGGHAMTTTDLEPVTGEIERRSPRTCRSTPPRRNGDGRLSRALRRRADAEDWIGHPGESDSFVKKSGWITLATFYGVSVELVGDTIARARRRRQAATRRVQGARHLARRPRRRGRRRVRRERAAVRQRPRPAEDRARPARDRRHAGHEPGDRETDRFRRRVGRGDRRRRPRRRRREALPDVGGRHSRRRDRPRSATNLATILRAVGVPSPSVRRSRSGARSTSTATASRTRARASPACSSGGPRRRAPPTTHLLARGRATRTRLDDPGASDDVATEADEADDAQRPTEGTAP